MTIRFTHQGIHFGARVVTTFSDDSDKWHGWSVKKGRGVYRFEDSSAGRYYEVPAHLCIVEGTLESKEKGE